MDSRERAHPGYHQPRGSLLTHAAGPREIEARLDTPASTRERQVSMLKPAEQIEVGDRLDIARKHRVAVVLVRNGRVLVRVETRGARSATVEQFTLGQTVRTY